MISDASLTPREFEIVVLIVKGSTDKQVAQRLGISVHTARTHRRNIHRKTKCKNLRGLMSYAIQNQIVGLSVFE